MDQADAEDTAGEGEVQPHSDEAPAATSHDKEQPEEASKDKMAQKQATKSSKEGEAVLGTAEENMDDSPGIVGGSAEAVNSAHSTAVSKRPLDESVGKGGKGEDRSAAEGPPAKNTTSRQLSLKPKPNVPPDKRTPPAVLLP
ncbi:submandibular gland secretory Glx-rich protein CB-like [Dermacentor albipictus]|uniref:submandibular gland secretory Glx-rich protein CB-like n=1 Tax=Dermacentor albipictus TaxID=60249 RepID=UPI0038FD0DC8